MVTCSRVHAAYITTMEARGTHHHESYRQGRTHQMNLPQLSLRTTHVPGELAANHTPAWCVNGMLHGKFAKSA